MKLSLYLRCCFCFSEKPSDEYWPIKKENYCGCTAPPTACMSTELKLLLCVWSLWPQSPLRLLFSQSLLYFVMLYIFHVQTRVGILQLIRWWMLPAVGFFFLFSNITEVLSPSWEWTGPFPTPQNINNNKNKITQIVKKKKKKDGSLCSYPLQFCLRWESLKVVPWDRGPDGSPQEHNEVQIMSL